MGPVRTSKLALPEMRRWSLLAALLVGLLAELGCRSTQQAGFASPQTALTATPQQTESLRSALGNLYWPAEHARELHCEIDLEMNPRVPARQGRPGGRVEGRFRLMTDTRQGLPPRLQLERLWLTSPDQVIPEAAQKRLDELVRLLAFQVFAPHPVLRLPQQEGSQCKQDGELEQFTFHTEHAGTVETVTIWLNRSSEVVRHTVRDEKAALEWSFFWEPSGQVRRIGRMTVSVADPSAGPGTQEWRLQYTEVEGLLVPQEIVPEGDPPPHLPAPHVLLEFRSYSADRADLRRESPSATVE